MKKTIYILLLLCFNVCFAQDGTNENSDVTSKSFEIKDLKFDYELTYSDNFPLTVGTLSMNVVLYKPASRVTLLFTHSFYVPKYGKFFYHNRASRNPSETDTCVNYSLVKINWGVYFYVNVVFLDGTEEKSEVYNTTDMLSDEDRAIVLQHSGVSSVETSENSIIYANNYLTVESENDGKISFYDYSGIEFKTMNFEAKVPIFIDESFPKFFIAVASLENGKVLTKKILK